MFCSKQSKYPNSFNRSCILSTCRRKTLPLTQQSLAYCPTVQSSISPRAWIRTVYNSQNFPTNIPINAHLPITHALLHKCHRRLYSCNCYQGYSFANSPSDQTYQMTSWPSPILCVVIRLQFPLARSVRQQSKVHLHFGPLRNSQISINMLCHANAHSHKINYVVIGAYIIALHIHMYKAECGGSGQQLLGHSKPWTMTLLRCFRPISMCVVAIAFRFASAAVLIPCVDQLNLGSYYSSHNSKFIHRNFFGFFFLLLRLLGRPASWFDLPSNY